MTAENLVSARSIRAGERADCERVLRALPEWFGIESSLAAYVRDTERFPTWVAELGGRVIGFVTVREYFAKSAEIHCMGVLREFHRAEVGRALVKVVERACREKGVEYLQVKTLGPSKESEPYTRTRRFYEAMGFVALEEFENLWPGNPCLLLVKRL